MACPSAFADGVSSIQGVVVMIHGGKGLGVVVEMSIVLEDDEVISACW